MTRSQCCPATPSSSQPTVDSPCSASAVAGHVHDWRAVLQRPELVEGGERRAGVVGLVAQRPVELGGVPDRLVDGEPQVRRVDDQVVAPGLDRRGAQLLGRGARAAPRARRPSPSHALPCRGRRGTPSRDRPAARAFASSRSARLPCRPRRRRVGTWTRTRCWVVACRPGRRRTCSRLRPVHDASTWSTPSAASSRRLQSASSETLSVSGTVNGSTS